MNNILQNIIYTNIYCALHYVWYGGLWSISKGNIMQYDHIGSYINNNNFYQLRTILLNYQLQVLKHVIICHLRYYFYNIIRVCEKSNIHFINISWYYLCNIIWILITKTKQFCLTCFLILILYTLFFNCKYKCIGRRYLY